MRLNSGHVGCSSCEDVVSLKFPCHEVEGVFSYHSAKFEFDWWFSRVIVEDLMTPLESVTQICFQD